MACTQSLVQTMAATRAATKGAHNSLAVSNFVFLRVVLLVHDFFALEILFVANGGLLAFGNVTILPGLGLRMG
jgi:hypothetical protein